jgi:hypothetical protein
MLVLTKVTLFERLLAKHDILLYDVQMKEKFHKNNI